jgi:S-adenosylmethionine:tRNA ribosyltransferase-isomerase
MVRPAGPKTSFDFELPDALSAKEPPEKRGLARDGIRLLAADRRTGALSHGRFRDLAGFLKPDDCIVLNASRTLPASLPARLGGAPVEVRLARRTDPNLWAALILDAFENPREGYESGTLRFPGGLTAEVSGRDPANPRLRRIRFSESGPGLMQKLSRMGKPVRYWYASEAWGLDWYQTVFAREPGSMEMPSAGRAFTWRMLLDLRKRGISTAFLVLHAGLSSYMDQEFDATHPVSVEPYRIGPEAAATINRAKETGGRIVAVGTTVVRALESAADRSGRVRMGEASTALRITRDHPLKIADGLITGFHEPEASHLDLLTAFLPEEGLKTVYAEALRARYLWHEFGDANLIL